MWLKVADGRYCGNCEIPMDHWVLYGQTGRVIVETSFCPICYPDLKNLFGEEQTGKDGASRR